jgi:plastocyanin
MRKMLVIMMFVFVWNLAACGSNKVALNGAPTGAAADPPTAAGPTAVSVTLKITMIDDSYDSPTYTVPAGATVTVKLTNEGAAAHTFDILKKGEQLDTFEATDEDKILWELSALAGETKSGTFTAPAEPGEYQIICRVPGHLLVGMTSTLIVK